MQLQRKRPEWHVNESRGKSIEAYGRKIVPVGRVLQVCWPGGEFSWLRPVAVEIHEGGEVRRLPIRDVTRRSIMMMVVAGFTVSIFVSVWRRGMNTQRRNRS